MFQVNPASDQGIVGKDNTLSITDRNVPAHVRGQSPSVARLRFVVPDGEALCTGFLVGANLLMTNEHCISSDEQAPGALVEFNYDSEAASTRRYRIVKVEAADFGLDYALVRLSGEVTGQSRMFLDTTPSKKGARLFVVQHPEGKPKRAAFWPDCGVEVDEVLAVPPRRPISSTYATRSRAAPALRYSTGPAARLWAFTISVPKGREDLVNQAVHMRDVIADLRAKVESGALGKDVLNEVTRSQ